jgi:hypothetical protein
VCLNDPPSCTGGSIATSRPSHARQVDTEKSDEELSTRSFAGGVIIFWAVNNSFLCMH